MFEAIVHTSRVSPPEHCTLRTFRDHSVTAGSPNPEAAAIATLLGHIAALPSMSNYPPRRSAVKIGPAVRTRLGRFEIPAADAYRSVFINLEDTAHVLASATGGVQRILEVGCGDGSLAQRLVAAFPEATYEGIDVAEHPGGLYRGDPNRARFSSIDSSTFRRTGPEPFDLVVVVDVIHHVPSSLRPGLLEDVRALTRDGGWYGVKEWEPDGGLAHFMAWAADRYITGDDIEHISPADLKALVAERNGDDVVLESRVPPRRNNYLLLYRR
jgi:SAM-dependent methyltransferase